MKNFNNKVVFLTGAATGIGFDIARAFTEAGASVIITDIAWEKVSDAVSILKKEKLVALGMECDVTNESQVISVIDRVYQIYGKIDILINNAGLQHVSPIEEFPVKQFELLLKVMLVGSFITIKKVFPMMKKQRYGRIINMASINGLIGFSGKSAYNSAKHGLIGLTKVAALEGAEFNITVNALCPGYVNTDLLQNQLSDLAETRNIPIENVIENLILPLIPQKRLLSVDEISNYTLFLADEKARGVTGQAVVIDGGYTVQ